MTNKEFYGDKLLAIAICGKSKCQSLHELVFNKSCQGKSCCDCEFYTVESVENWLNAEHEEPEPPLLENGDGLKSGDWIMVREVNNTGWRKGRFVGYLNCRFYIEDEAIADIANGWKQARLPMEGE